MLEYSPDTGGWFLFGHANPDRPAQFDNWYEDVAIARQQAMDDWGVGPDAWKELA